MSLVSFSGKEHVYSSVWREDMSLVLFKDMKLALDLFYFCLNEKIERVVFNQMDSSHACQMVKTSI